MKKKIVSIMLATSMAATLFAGCGSQQNTSAAASGQTNSSEKAESTEAAATETAAETTEASSSSVSTNDAVSDISGEITFVSANDQTGALDEMIAAFNEVYPNVTVDHQVLPGASDDVKKSLMVSLASGSSDPDVFESDIIWLSQFAAAGWLLDVTDEVESVADQYLAGPLSTVYYEDRAYGFPDYTDVGLLYYRTDLIDTPPTTWEELEELSKEHIGQDGIEYGYVFQMFQGEPTSCNMLEFIKQNGGSDLVDGQFQVNSANSVESLEFVEHLIESGISPEGVLSHKPDDTRAIFEEGKALFMRNWTYAYAGAEADTSKVKGNVGVTTLPVGPNGTESSGTLGGWNFAVSQYTDNQEAAVAFAKFMSSYEAQKISTLVRGTFPTNSAVYEDEDVLADRPYLPGISSAAENAKPRPQVRDYSAISSIFQVYFHKALTGELSNEEALEQLDTELNAALAEMS